MLILVLKKSELNEAHMLQYIRCKNFQIRLRLIVYLLERINHDTVFLLSFSILLVSISDVFHV